MTILMKHFKVEEVTNDASKGCGTLMHFERKLTHKNTLHSVVTCYAILHAYFYVS